MMYFSPYFMRKNQEPSQMNVPWVILSIPMGRDQYDVGKVGRIFDV